MSQNPQYFASRTVSAVDTAQSVVIDMQQIHDTLALHSAASAGTAALTIEGSTDGVNYLTLDTLGAAATQIKQYVAATVGAGIALSPLSFRWVKITAATAGADNTTTLTISAK